MKSILNESCITFEEKKSKFIGYAKPVSTRKEAEAFITSIKTKHKDATHNCSAYKVLDNGQEYFKTDDDGEPAGTAGKPMGDVITYMDVSNVVVIATRYFGGIKLGAGGLIRNYAKTAKLAIVEGIVSDYIERKVIMLEFTYDKIGEVEAVINESDGEYLEKGYNEKVAYKVKVDQLTIDNLKLIKGVSIIFLECI